MDGFRFDSLTKIIASRRTSRQGLPRLALAAGLAAAGPGWAATRAERTCLADGSSCHMGGINTCCDGARACRPINRSRNGRCRGAKRAAGCTGRENSCARRSEPDGVPCPRDAGGRCVVLDNGRPFCAREAACFECRSNADCNRRFKRTGGRCPRCNNCSRSDRRACVLGRRS